VRLRRRTAAATAAAAVALGAGLTVFVSTRPPTTGTPGTATAAARPGQSRDAGPGRVGGHAQASGALPQGGTRGPGGPGSPARPAVAPLPCPRPRGGYLTATPATSARTVALTFDDGPSAWTPKFLALLARHHVHATFFMVGERAAARPDLVRQVVAAGDLVGNHSWDHPLHPPLSRLPAERVRAEIGQAQTTLTRLAGWPPCFFRGPGEAHRSAAVINLAQSFGLTVTDTTRTARDAGSPRNARYDPAWRDLIVTRLTAAGSHPIVLMHDGHSDNKVNELSALEEIIVWYQSRGYVFTDPAGRPFGAAPAGRPVRATPVERPVRATPVERPVHATGQS
jgi:peptidoglycan/xylan/chitin deacetylase (PgdA/CDA1 family)